MSTLDQLDQSVDVEMPKYVELVVVLVVVWGIGDTATTVLASVVTGSAAGELNPLVRTLLAAEPLAVVLLKGAVAVYVGVVLLACQDIVERVPGWQIWFFGMISIGTVIVGQNLSVVVASM